MSDDGSNAGSLIPRLLSPMGTHLIVGNLTKKNQAPPKRHKKRKSDDQRLVKKRKRDADHRPNDQEVGTPDNICLCGDAWDPEITRRSWIRCHNQNCSRKMYHMECVGIAEGPSKGISWVCDECRGSGRTVRLHDGSPRADTVPESPLRDVPVPTDDSPELLEKPEAVPPTSSAILKSTRRKIPTLKANIAKIRATSTGDKVSPQPNQEEIPLQTTTKRLIKKSMNKETPPKGSYKVWDDRSTLRSAERATTRHTRASPSPEEAESLPDHSQVQGASSAQERVLDSYQDQIRQGSSPPIAEEVSSTQSKMTPTPEKRVTRSHTRGNPILEESETTTNNDEAQGDMTNQGGTQDSAQRQTRQRPSLQLSGKASAQQSETPSAPEKSWPAILYEVISMKTQDAQRKSLTVRQIKTGIRDRYSYYKDLEQADVLDYEVEHCLRDHKDFFFQKLFPGFAAYGVQPGICYDEERGELKAQEDTRTARQAISPIPPPPPAMTTKPTKSWAAIDYEIIAYGTNTNKQTMDLDEITDFIKARYPYYTNARYRPALITGLKGPLVYSLHPAFFKEARGDGTPTFGINPGEFRCRKTNDILTASIGQEQSDSGPQKELPHNEGQSTGPQEEDSEGDTGSLVSETVEEYWERVDAHGGETYYTERELAARSKELAASGKRKDVDRNPQVNQQPESTVRTPIHSITRRTDALAVTSQSPGMKEARSPPAAATVSTTSAAAPTSIAAPAAASTAPPTEAPLSANMKVVDINMEYSGDGHEQARIPQAAVTVSTPSAAAPTSTAASAAAPTAAALPTARPNVPPQSEDLEMIDIDMNEGDDQEQEQGTGRDLHEPAKENLVTRDSDAQSTAGDQPRSQTTLPELMTSEEYTKMIIDSINAVVSGLS